MTLTGRALGRTENILLPWDSQVNMLAGDMGHYKTFDRQGTRRRRYVEPGSADTHTQERQN
jgi:hypothetical protein